MKNNEENQMNRSKMLANTAEKNACLYLWNFNKIPEIVQ